MNELVFDGRPMQLVEHDGRMWLRSADIARALGYTRSDKLTQVYSRHQAEFSPSMTSVFQNLSLGHGAPPSEIRLFSLRGAHLLGMFARTAKGQEFRRWVLDQLDAMEARKVENRSLMAAWYEASAALDNQNRFASMCGRGLSDHKRRKPVLTDNVMKIADKMQPSLLLT